MTIAQEKELTEGLYAKGVRIYQDRICGPHYEEVFTLRLNGEAYCAGVEFGSWYTATCWASRNFLTPVPAQAYEYPC